MVGVLLRSTVPNKENIVASEIRGTDGKPAKL